MPSATPLNAANTLPRMNRQVDNLVEDGEDRRKGKQRRLGWRGHLVGHNATVELVDPLKFDEAGESAALEHDPAGSGGTRMEGLPHSTQDTPISTTVSLDQTNEEAGDLEAGITSRKPPRSRVVWNQVLPVLAMLYTFAALAALILDSYPKVRLGFQIANLALLGIFVGTSLVLGKLDSPGRYYMRDYLLSTLVSHIIAHALGVYTNAVHDNPRARTLHIIRVAQGVQLFPLLAVILLNVKIKVEKRS